MDDCGDHEVFPGIFESELGYEHRKALVEKFENCCDSWKCADGFWKLTNLQLSYFDAIYLPYIYNVLEPKEDIYEETFTTNNVTIDDPWFSNIFRINTTAIEHGKKPSVLVIVGTKYKNTISLEQSIGVGQFLTIPVLTQGHQLYIKGYHETQSANDGQVVSKIYDGNNYHWHVSRSNINKAYEKCAKKRWPITEINELLAEKHTCVTTMDVLQRLLLLVDLCNNIDFYIWLGDCVDMWSIWPDVACDSVTQSHLNDMSVYEGNFETMLKDFRMLGKNECSLNRKNLYLGCPDCNMLQASPFYSMVSNGIFSLEE